MAHWLVLLPAGGRKPCHRLSSAFFIPRLVPFVLVTFYNRPR